MVLLKELGGATNQLSNNLRIEKEREPEKVRSLDDTILEDELPHSPSHEGEELHKTYASDGERKGDESTINILQDVQSSSALKESVSIDG